MKPGARFARWIGTANSVPRFGFPPFADPRGVILSFDDGPDPASTPAILEALDHNGLRAVFFLTGSRVITHPALARDIAAAGHQLGSHGHTHAHIAFQRRPVVERHLTESNAAILAATGITPAFYRPPYGRINPAHLPLLASHGMALALWNRMVGDYDASVPFSRHVRYVQSAVRPGDIVLLHDTPLTAPFMAGLVDAIARSLAEQSIPTTVFAAPAGTE